MREDLVHGGAIDAMRRAFPDAQEPWIDLSTGVNPWPYPETAVSPEAFAHLPTRACQEACVTAMEDAIGAPRSSLLLSPGSELLIRLLPDVIRPRRVAILAPTYGDHSAVWKRAGADVEETSDPLRYASSVDAVVVTNPNNPNGRIFDRRALEAARQTLAAHGGWLIVDEAYADLVPELSLAASAGAGGLIVLRSFGKFFGLAGLRLGALLAPADVRDAVAARLGVWPISGAALEIGARAYRDTAWHARIRDKLGDAAIRLDETLKAGHLVVVGGTSLYRFVEAPNAHSVFERLAQAGVYVRRFNWSKTHLRIGLPPTLDGETRLRAALSP
ncbi:MAG: threonine-phosphate decarboxylase CobD [Pseudomonadota bacterium]